MSNGKGKEVATELDWKDKLAMLDQEFGWDEQAGSDWADSCETEEQEANEECQMVSATAKLSISSSVNMTDHGYAASNEVEEYIDNGSDDAFHQPLDTLEDDTIMSPEVQRQIWEAAVKGSKYFSHDYASEPFEGSSTHATQDDNEVQVDDPQQQENEISDEYLETEYEQEEEEEEEEEQFQPKSALAADLYHLFGPDIRYEDRCSCCERLVDPREERRKRDREYFAQAGGSCLIKDPCVLLPYKQEDLPGTENVDKPVLMVTTPEGETLFPHDLEEYPEPPPKMEYLVPYEDEDGADI